MRQRGRYILGIAVVMAMLLAACTKSTTGGTSASPSASAAAASGANFDGWNNAEATKLMKDSDKELDEAKRVEEFKKIGALTFKDIASIPLYAKPSILVWNSAKLGADLDFNGGQAAFSGELPKWSLKGSDTLKFGAEQWPTCLNQITSCANSSWLFYLTNVAYPKLTQLTAGNEYEPSYLIKEIPSKEKGTLTESPFSVTYDLNDANWADGTKITGEDIKFTWQAVMKTPDALSRVGYEKITDVVTAGSKVTIKFKEPYAPWKDLFGSGAGGIMEAKAFNNNPNVTGKMATDLPFSGGPYKIDKFDTNEMDLSRNDKYTGPKPAIAKVIFLNKQAARQAGEVAAFRTGEVDAFFPQPADALSEVISGKVANGKVKAKGGTQYEGLWFNLDMHPVDELAVRQAILFGLDRQAAIDKVVNDLLAPTGFKAKVSPCLLNVPDNAGGKWCNNDFPVTQDQAKAEDILVKAGWKPFDDAGKPIKEADLPKTLGDNATITLQDWKKNGKTLEFKYGTTAGNTGREQFQLILVKQLEGIGIHVRTDNSVAGYLFQTRQPSRDWQVLMYASVATPDPTATSNWAGDQIPPCKTCPGNG
ncbi:MAG: ABC transporter substrate-binding protein [Actinomycetota bacterium]|nr:ABC transporter substrate-binding protein [Actinomycetota bacterium]